MKDFFARFSERLTKSDTLNYGNVASACIAVLIAAILIGSWTPKMSFIKHELSDVSQIAPTRSSTSSSAGGSSSSSTSTVEHEAGHGVATPSSPEAVRKPIPSSEHHETAAPSDFWLDCFTFLLVIVAALQVAWMVRQQQVIAEQGRAIEGLKELAEKQTAIAATQADIADKANAAGHMQFLAAHRPELKIRGISMNELKVGEKVSARILISNSGSTRTTIQEGTATILISKDGNILDLPEYDESRVSIRNPSLEPGSKNSFTKVSDFTLTEEQYESVFPKNKKSAGALYLFGYLQYEDGSGNKRTTGFCRRYDPTAKRFKVVNDENYEYMD